MFLGGLQKHSLIDYPGKISCVLFFSGCNFKCPFCHNPELVKGCRIAPHLSGHNELYRFLKKRRTLLDGVVISGGEPTLQKDLLTCCTNIKQLGYPVKLDTNGSRPNVIRRLLDQKLVDYVAMDIKTDPLCYSPTIAPRQNPAQILSSIQVIMDSAPDYEFRTTCVKPLVNGWVVDKISRIIEGARRYALQQFRSINVLHPEHFRNNGQVHRQDELRQLKTIAAARVAECIIR